MMRPIGSLAVALLFVVSAGHTTESVVPQSRDHVYVAVADRRGRPVKNLSAADFAIEIDDRPQEILSVAPATEPLSIVLLTDRLGLQTYTHVDVHGALSSFVGGIRTAVPQSRFALTTFDGPVVRLASFGAPPAELDRLLGRLTTLAEGAALLDALTDACTLIGTAPTRRRVILLVFAAYRPDISTATPELVGAMLQASGASLWTIEARVSGENAFGQVNRELVVDRGTGITGGRRDIVASAVGVERMAREMASLIASQYQVTYGPGNGSASSQRKVMVQRPDVRVYAPAWLTK
jgi:hypothetical protein